MSSIGIAPRQPPSLDFPHFRGDSILIYLSVSGTPPSAAAVPMRVLPSEPLASVKLRICGLVGGRHHRLVLAGRDLARDHCPVGDYGVRHGDVLHLVVRVSDLREIRVETACGRTIDLRVDRSRSVGFLKEEVARKAEGIVDLTGHRLVRAGEELEDWVVVGDLCGDNNDEDADAGDDDAVIHLILRRPAKVRTHAVGRDFELSVVAPESPQEWQEDPEGKPQLEPVVANPKAELSPVLGDLIRSALAGLAMGRPPVRSPEGSGGAYFMRDASGTRYVAVFKPMDEEPTAENDPRGLPPSLDGEGLKRGTRVGEGALREVAAYVLDHPLRGRRYHVSDMMGFSGVPPTVMVRCLHEGFNHPGGFEYSAGNFKIGSLQMFVRNSGSCEDVGPKFFPVQEVHKISVLDIRLANTDRHGGNILVHREGEEGRIVLVPIDHGYCLPENFEDCTFEWLYWPQAREPYNSETVEYIKSLDAEQDIALLKFYGWELSTECARTLRVSTMLLKKGVERGFTPFSIGNILCRETIKKKSMIEEIVNEAKGTVLPGSGELAFVESVSEIMDRRLDELTR